MKTSVILPTFNERANIVDLLRAIEQVLEPLGQSYELVVVDDDSPDGTAAAVQAYQTANGSAVKLIVRKEQKGLAKAVRCGLEQASGDLLLVMDTDFNHDPCMIPQMIELLKYYDLVIGSRFVMGGGMEDQARYYLSFLFNFFVRVTISTQIQDNLSGFFSIRKERLGEMDLDDIFYGYGDYFIRLLWTAWGKRLKILEVPVYYVLRRHGSSKSRFLSMFRDYTVAVLRLRLTKGHWR